MHQLPFFFITQAQSKTVINLSNDGLTGRDTAHRVEAHPFAPQPRGSGSVWLHLPVLRGSRRLFDVTCQTLPKQHVV